ncbi:F0F1 ATP synthase subunit B [Helicobacter sp. 11S03491-1]|uniref:F0F1 ATP synthase subunit B n=1 Tax=Helicobacter sp. 11S03491-1 TaxID=1476196 RepID=UPI0015D97D15|nr:F0F1 ATP synthase subunit B [Helicobacter sp. 11S03491-1]
MKYIVLLLFCTSCLFAQEVNISDTDIVERVINFVIFLAILWYFVADKLKQIFVSRREGIAKKLNEVQDKFKNAKKEKEQALRKLEEAKEKASDMLAIAKKEAYLIAQKIDEQSKSDIEHLIKNNEILMDFEQKKMEKQVVDEILSELFKTKTSSLEISDYIHILNKKVA